MLHFNAESCFAQALIVIAVVCLPAAPAKSEDPLESTIRTVLEKWTADFNAGNTENICGLFDYDLRYDYRGHPERNYSDICNVLHRSLADRTKKYSYSFKIKEVLVEGELAIVRLVWTLQVRSISDPGSSVETTEPGMDIFRRQTDGSWKIIRYIAYEE